MDAFWDREIAKMKALDPQLELIPAEFQASYAECFDLFFTGVDGARVYAKYLRPRGRRKPPPGVVMFHGYTGNSGDWTDKLAYVAQGFSVAAWTAAARAANRRMWAACRATPFAATSSAAWTTIPDKMLYSRQSTSTPPSWPAS